MDIVRRNLTPPLTHLAVPAAALTPAPPPAQAPSLEPAQAPAVAAAAVASVAVKPPLSQLLPLPSMPILVTDASWQIQEGPQHITTLADYNHEATSSFHERLRPSTRGVVVQLRDFDCEAALAPSPPPALAPSLELAHAPAPTDTVAAAAMASVAAFPLSMRPISLRSLPVRPLPLLPLPMPMLVELVTDAPWQTQHPTTLAGYNHDAISCFQEPQRQSTRGVIMQLPDFDCEVRRNLTPPLAHLVVPAAALTPAPPPAPAPSLEPAQAPAVAAAAVASVAVKPPLSPLLPLPSILVTDASWQIQEEPQHITTLVDYNHEATSSFQSTRGVLVHVPDLDSEVRRNLTPPLAHLAVPAAALTPAPAPALAPSLEPAQAPAVAAAAVASVAVKPPLSPLLPLPSMPILVTDASWQIQEEPQHITTLADYNHEATSSFQSTRGVLVHVPDLDSEVFSLHMPTDSEVNLTEFTNCLSEITAIVEDCNIDSVFILGDFNAKPGALFGDELNDFCVEQRWRSADMEILGSASDTYTFVSDVYGSYLTSPPAHRATHAAELAPAPAVTAAAVANVAVETPQLPLLPLPLLPLPMLEELVIDIPRLIQARNLATLAGCIHNVTSSFHETLRENTRGLLVRLPDFDFEGDEDVEAASSTRHRLTDARCLLWNAASPRFTSGIQQVLDFAERLPGYNSLPQTDQIILIKQGFFEVFITRAHLAVSPDYMVLGDGTIMTQSNLAIIYNPEFAASMLSYMWSLWRMQLSDDEVGALTGVLLLAPTRVGLSAAEEVAGWQRALGDALRFAVTQNADPLLAQERLDTLLELVDEARLLGLQHESAMQWCRDNWYRLILPELFADVFDIPKLVNSAN